MGIIKTAILTGGGIYAVNKIAKSAERRHDSPYQGPRDTQYSQPEAHQRSYMVPPAQPSQDYYHQAPGTPPRYQEREMYEDDKRNGYNPLPPQQQSRQTPLSTRQRAGPDPAVAAAIPSGENDTYYNYNHNDNPATSTEAGAPSMSMPVRQQQQQQHHHHHQYQSGFVVPESQGDYFHPPEQGQQRPAPAALLESGLGYAAVQQGKSRQNGNDEMGMVLGGQSGEKLLRKLFL